MTCACTETSSILVGSSKIRIFGSKESALAIMIRCASPPLIWCG